MIEKYGKMKFGKLSLYNYVCEVIWMWDCMFTQFPELFIVTFAGLF